MRQIEHLIKHASTAPFYKRRFMGAGAEGISRLEGSTLRLRRERSAERLTSKGFAEKIPPVTLEELVAEKISSGDPYSLRRAKGRDPLVVFQLEYDTETALYIALDRDDLQRYAEALRRCWSLLGLKRGDRVAIFDYGTSPVSYLASSAFTPYLRQGAADALGCLPVCNDGGTNMSQRAVEIVKLVRPRILFLRSDCLYPFAVEVERESLRLSDHTRSLVAVENEGVLAEAERRAFQNRLGVPIYRLLRIDAAMFLAIECPRCRLWHTWPDLYVAEAAPEEVEKAGDRKTGSLVITNRFAKACPTIRYRSQVKAALAAPGCPRGPRDLRIAA